MFYGTILSIKHKRKNMVFKRPLEKGEVFEDNRFAALNTQVFVAGEAEVVAEVAVTPAEVVEVAEAAPAEEVVAPVEDTVEEVAPEVESPAEATVEAPAEEVAPLVAE
jgi:hypothetical protein